MHMTLKSLLSVLRNRTVDKTVNRCELSIIEGGAESEDNEDQDSLESKLIVRLHCEHGNGLSPYLSTFDLSFQLVAEVSIHRDRENSSLAAVDPDIVDGARGPQ